MMDISFIMLTWNSEKYIKNCLKTLIGDLRSFECTYEIFIIDNGSLDGTRLIIESFKSQLPDNIKPIFLVKNTGTTYSRNLAMKQAIGKYICVMDSDVEVMPGSIENLIRKIGNNQKIGLIAPKLNYPSGVLQKSTDSFPTLYNKLRRYFFLKLIEKKENRENKVIQAIEVDYAISAMWVMTSDVMKDVGLFDEKIFYAPEDVDYCLRIRQAGYKIVYDPDTVAVHHTQELSRGIKLNRAKFEHVKGLVYYFNKYNTWFKRPLHDINLN